ncbi:MAG: nucleoside hydrolase, partial [Pseudonocardiaceae bacterium]|nr:nucleoside hydrolase [Pseudonocardiaceae bacterium]
MRLIVDTDTASDDAVALLMAALAPHAELHAVTTVAGNVPLPQATRNALLTLERVGAEQVPVFPGCDRPLVRPLDTAQHVHGEDGMGDLGLPEPRTTADTRHAVDMLLSLSTARAGEFTLVTLGPLTNIAAAVVR